MPLYTYRAQRAEEACDTCREDFDVKQGMDEERLTHCPSCGVEIKRIIVGAAYISGTRYGDKMTAQKMKAGALKRLVKDDTGQYREDTLR